MARGRVFPMFDPPGSSLFALRAAIGCILMAWFSFLGGWHWVAAPLAAAGIYCFWTSITAKGTDY